MAVTADDILRALAETCDRSMIWASELALSSGARRCDFWTLAPCQSKGYAATAYEIKVSRADFRRDTPAKQREARLFSDRFYYATPPGLLKPDEVPDWAGLIEVDPEAEQFKRRRIIVQAPLRDKDAPSWELIVSLLRCSGTIERDSDMIREQRNAYRRMLTVAADRLKADGKSPWDFGIHLS
ncbi:hypothetical protein S2M10_29530 [Sphingomonas sp. S2M10]|uniref:MmcB family DNA repair protein n=1 Tax=Sphingomonas sp. S2M10 TaxID=2705010 RepID=UPI001456F4FB|nr:MmcB family DNA repair protein [Sphingomonas sp. S2M10]NLS27951.1 hypothetical protein [Sphingomonas sp. S2M10]